MAEPAVLTRLRRLPAIALPAVLALVAGAGCDLPFGLGLPTTRALENGAVSTLASATSLELSGSYAESGQSWSIDVQLVPPDIEHALVGGPSGKLEAIVLSKNGYFRGQDFLSQHMGSDPVSRDLVKAAGSGWWKGSTASAPRLPDFTNGDQFRATFLGPAVSRRTDHVTVDGADAVEMSGPRADVFIAAAPPYQPLRVHLLGGVVVDGLRDADLRYGNFNRDFRIAAPAAEDVIDFSNLSTLPPIYTVLSVDASRCASPCLVSALLKNLGATQGAKAPSTVTFKMTDTASGNAVGTCQATVKPDVPFNATTTVSCTIPPVSGISAAVVTATPDNPGRA